jgi:hypothetical protein
MILARGLTTSMRTMRHGAIQLGIRAIFVSGIHEHHICSLTRRQQNACYHTISGRYSVCIWDYF